MRPARASRNGLRRERGGSAAASDVFADLADEAEGSLAIFEPEEEPWPEALPLIVVGAKSEILFYAESAL